MAAILSSTSQIEALVGSGWSFRGGLGWTPLPTTPVLASAQIPVRVRLYPKARAGLLFCVKGSVE